MEWSLETDPLSELPSPVVVERKWVVDPGPVEVRHLRHLDGPATFTRLGLHAVVIRRARRHRSGPRAAELHAIDAGYVG